MPPAWEPEGAQSQLLLPPLEHSKSLLALLIRARRAAFCPIPTHVLIGMKSFIHTFTHLSIHLFIHPSLTSTFNLSPICLLPIDLSIDPFSSNDSSFCLSTHAAIHLSILPSINFSFHHSIMHRSIQSLLSSIFTSLDPSKHPLPLYPCHPHQGIPH